LWLLIETNRKVKAELLQSMALCEKQLLRERTCGEVQAAAEG